MARRTLTTYRRPLAAALAAASMMCAAGAAGAATVTNVTLYDVDNNGANTATGSVVDFGGWTTVLDQQNVPGNYAAELFLATSQTPTSLQFLTPGATTSLSLHPGSNTFYFWGDSDDTRGGTFGFGLNVFLDGAGATSPSISALTTVGASSPVMADGASGCTAGFTLACTPGAGTLTAGSVQLSDFEVFARGGGSGGEDRVGSTNSSAFTPPPSPDGVNDTYGSFTLFYTPAGVPEPATWAMMLLGVGLIGGGLRMAGRKEDTAPEGHVRPRFTAN